MRTVNVSVDADFVRTPLGIQYENEATEIVFDCSTFVTEHGSGTAQVIHRRPTESIGYVCTNVSQTGSTVTWLVTDDDTSFTGKGQVQVRWYVDDVLRESAIFPTYILPSVASSDDAPAEVKSALEQLMEWVNDNTISIEDLDERIGNYFDEHPIPTPVTSVNRLTGDVVITPELLGVYTQDEVDDLAYGAYPYDTASGSVASFPDGAEVPVKDLVIGIDPVQAGSGDPSPTNVRAISGWTGATITHYGEDSSDATTTSVSWSDEAGTVYGGTLDLTTGVLTVTYGIKDMGSVSYTYDSSNDYFYTPVSDKLRGNFNIICSCYKTTAATTVGSMADLEIKGHATANRICIKDSNYKDSDSFKTAVTGQTICYELATPITYQLTAQEMYSIFGYNNIFCDTGDTTVVYRADPTLYIRRLTGADDDMTADSNITSGSYFVVNNNLYLATTAIASGETIEEGTNCTKTDLASALNALNA